MPFACIPTPLKNSAQKHPYSGDIPRIHQDRESACAKFTVPGNSFIASLRGRFGEEIQKREITFAKWLVASGPGPLDGSDLTEARDALRTWRVMQDTEETYVDTPGKVTSY